MDITVSELKSKIESGEKFIFLDVREPAEYNEFNIGATLRPLGMIEQTAQEFAEHKNEEIVVHCRSGARSGAAKDYLTAQGYTNVRNVLGGILAWQDSFGG